MAQTYEAKFDRDGGEWHVHYPMVVGAFAFHTDRKEALRVATVILLQLLADRIQRGILEPDMIKVSRL